MRPQDGAAVRLRRLIALAIYTVLAVILVATLVVAWAGLRDGKLKPLDLWAGVIPVFLSIITVVLGPLHTSGRARLSLAQTATALAHQVVSDWTEESRHRGLYRERRMRVRWQAAPGSDRTSRLTATLPDRGDLDQLTAGFGRHVRSGRLTRLVVTGDMGAGKTAACVLLTLELGDRGPAVPVVFQLSSWNPGVSLLEWMAQELRVNYPFSSDEAEDKKAAAQLARHHVLPVLDGLDEMKDPAAALRRIEDELAGRSFVLSSRTETFTAANRGHLLRHALIVELQPLRADEERGILIAGDPDAGEGGLAPLVARLDAEPTGPVAEALRTPFILSLAVALGESLPQDVLSATGPDAADRIKRHLLGSFVDKAYPRVPGPDDDRITADQARRYLAFLARHADRATGRLAWWRLHRAVPRTVFLIVAVVVAGAVCSGLATGFFAVFGRPWLGFWIGLAAGVVGAFVVEFVPHDEPRRARPSLRSFGAPSRGALLTTLGFGAMGGAACAVIVWFLYGAPHYVIIGGVLSGLTFATARYISEPSDPARAVTPDLLLSTDLAAVLYAWLVGGIPGALTGGYLGASLQAGHRSPELDHVAIIQDLPSGVIALLGAVGGCGLSAAGLGLMAFGTSSWGRFTVARAWLAVRGSTPRGLMAFLRDARRRGLLRQVNGYYEFRHRLLQRHLAESSPRTWAEPALSPWADAPTASRTGPDNAQ